MTIRVCQLGNDFTRKWDAVVLENPHSGFMHSWDWAEFKKREGQETIRLGLFDDAELIGGSTIYFVKSSLGTSPFEVPHGPVISWERKDAKEQLEILTKEWRGLAGENCVPLVRVAPLLPLEKSDSISELPRAPMDLVPTPTSIVNLEGNENNILMRMKEKGRYNVRLGLKLGVTVSHGSSSDLIDDFYALFELSAMRHDFLSEPKSFFVNLIDTIKSSATAEIFFACYHGVTVASALIVFFGKKATYLYGGTLPFLKSSMSSYVLHWEVMREARKRGCLYYDLYGVAPHDQPFHPYSRFTQFKTRFGGSYENYVGARDIYFYPELARLWAKSIQKGVTYYAFGRTDGHADL